jgi:1-aminocyclopropane-1-carboxylate deaminase
LLLTAERVESFLPVLDPLRRMPGVPRLGSAGVLRLDLLDPGGAGNKLFKLVPALEQAASLPGGIVSVGGAWSNHLHALAAAGHANGIPTLGIVRAGDSMDTPTLRDAMALGMRLVPVSRGVYRERDTTGFTEQVLRAARLDWPRPWLFLPEGGGTVSAVASCRRIAAAACDWEIVDDAHEGGFARVSPALRAFMEQAEQGSGPPLEPVYSGKVMFALQRLLLAGKLRPEERLYVIHTGGLQGRRGYDWLSADSSGH